MTELRKRQLAWVAGISAIVAVLAVWTFAIDWEWSYIGDDASWVGKSQEASSRGPLGWLSYLGGLIASDATGWGLFRPFYQTSSLVIYELSPSLAHGLRFAMFAILFFTPVYIVWKGTRPGSARVWATLWTAALFLSGYTIIYGIYFVSLQEFTGMFLIAVGLLAKNGYLRGWLWLFAAWTKAPFIWVILLFGAQNLIGHKKRLGSVFLALGLISLTIITLSARSGSYTSGRLNINPWHLWSNVQLLGTYGALFLAILVIGLIVFAPMMKLESDSVVLFLGALLYAANLLPWNTIGYYNAPVWFLLTCAVATALKSNSTDSQLPNIRWVVPIIVGCLAAAALLAAETFRTDVFGRNQMVTEGRDWILKNLQANESYFIYDFSNTEFHFYLTQKNPSWDRDPPPQWKSGQPRPPETLNADYVVSTNEVPLAPEITKCPPIKVWTKGFLAPMKC